MCDNLTGGDWLLFLTIAILLLVCFIYRRCRKARRTEIEQRKTVLFGIWKSENTKRVNIVGLPNSGKTVYFCVCMDLLQRIFNELGNDYSVIYETAKTDQIVSNVIADLRDKGGEGWPANTQNPIEHCVSILSNTRKCELCFKDYSGEEFTRIYGDPEYLGALNDDVDQTEGSDGVIIIIASTLLLDKSSQELSLCLFNLLKELEIKNFRGKLALVVTQGDRVKNIADLEIEKLFMRQQPNSYARLKTLKCEYKFFLVTAVDCEIDDNGEYVPPKDYSPLHNSKNVCAPIEWLMDISLPDAK